MKLSIIATLYQSAPYIIEFHKRASITARKIAGSDYEIILVNDGSPDNSLSIAVQLTETDPHIIVVDLSRNFGHHKAMMTGLAQTKGQNIFLIDSDLEEEPEWLTGFVKQMEKDESDIVYGVQEQRKGTFFERWSGQWFYKLFNVFAGLNLPVNTVTARLMSRRYLDALLRHQESEIFLAGLFYITGFKQTCHTIKKHSKSPTTYTFQRKIAMFVNSITSFSNLPLVSIFYIGVTTTLISFFFVAYLIINWVFLNKPLSGWTSVMASIWLLSGILISSIGLVGIYLSKVFIETKKRPYTIIRQTYGQHK